MNLSHDQQKALDIVLDWFEDKSHKQYLTLGGYAGTGKTTLTSKIREKIHKKSPKINVAFCSFTGKATRVLKSKLYENKSVYEKDSVSTIHALIYSPEVDTKGEIVGWQRKEKVDFGLIIVDEASMVDSNIWQDLLSYKVPILAIGDHGQLPPIKGSFNLMDKPDIKLEQIHRQAKDNPIIELSMLARTEGKIPFGVFGRNVVKIDRSEEDSTETIGELLQNYNDNTLILCGYNTTRVKLNQYVRKSLEFDSLDPVPGDRVICLRNNHQKQIYNGMLGTILSIRMEDNNWYFAKIILDGEEESFSGMIYAQQFNNKDSASFTSDRSITANGDLFDFGYALTVHKAQGSQAKRVILFEERFAKVTDEEWRRWLYTGVTRAEEELFIVGR